MERTLAIIKPDAIQRSNEILYIIERAGFKILNQARIHLTIDQAKEFYQEHQEKPFYDSLVKYISSGPIMVLTLSRQEAIQHWRQILGPTDSILAKTVSPHSIRAIFGTDKTQNACHGSDSPKSAEREIHFFFPDVSLVSLPSPSEVSNFLECSLYPLLTKGLVELCNAKPNDPI
ncbi:NME NM23 member 5, partial [Coelomomyces lativittatus]